MIHRHVQLWADRLESVALGSRNCLYLDNSLTLDIREIDHTLPFDSHLNWLWLGLGYCDSGGCREYAKSYERLKEQHCVEAITDR
jgi:hypothetical protein